MKNFIESIDIIKVRHLNNIHIPLSKVEPRHLILTGKNGSGKTSVLEAIRDYFAEEIEKAGTSYTSLNKVSILFTDKIEVLKSEYQEHRLLLQYFGAFRLIKMREPIGPQKMDKHRKSIRYEPENADSIFLQYLVNLKTQQAYAAIRGSTNDEKGNKIEKWFKRFEELLKNVFQDDSLELKFYDNNYQFTLVSQVNGEFSFNMLSSGYNVIIKIITDLMLSMVEYDQEVLTTYDIEGIALIDEIDVHLHVDLQKKILPFLTTFFPNIQFIVTTHSPFVLSSIENSVIYDLESRVLVEDLSGYSYSGIIESYFDNDKYSTIIKDKMQRYENLLKNNNQLSTDETFELKILEEYLKNIDASLSNELSMHMKQLNLEYNSKK